MQKAKPQFSTRLLYYRPVTFYAATIGVRECIFLGMQRICVQVWSCFSQVTYKQQVLMFKTKTQNCKQIKVSARLYYQLLGFKAVRPQLAINIILHSHMW